jgi:hypothetical protein
MLLVVSPFAMKLFERTSAAQRLADRIRPAMTTASLDRLRSDFDTGRAAGEQLINQALPSLAPRLGESPAQLNASIQQRYPAVSAGFQQFPGIATKVDAVLRLFERDQGEFHAADTTPTSWLGFTAGPWLMLAFGLALIVLGALAFRTSRPSGLLAIGALGLALAVGPLLVSFPHKTAQSAALVDDLRPLITRPTANAVVGWQTTMDKMTAQLDDQMLPDLAAQLHQTPAQLTASLASQYPAVGAGLPRLPAIFADFRDKTRRLDASVGDFAQTKQIPYRALPWLFILPGTALVLMSGIALMVRGRRDESSGDSVGLMTAGAAAPPSAVDQPEVGAPAPDAHRVSTAGNAAHSD